MTTATFDQLLTAEGQAAIAAAMALAPAEARFLADFDRLRKRYPVDLAKAALETAILRQKAREKFPDADRLYFEREALEQATHHLVADHRARRFAKYSTVLDLGCGLGADAIALSQAGCRVVAVERDPLRTRMAKANFAALRLAIEVLEADALSAALPKADAIFCDPARRQDGQRHLASERYAPAPRDVLARFPGLPTGFKLAPGISRRDLEQFDGEIEFVSLQGELKECRLWTGGLTTASKRATVLPTGESITGEESFERTIDTPKSFILLPDASVIRAGLETVLTVLLHSTFLDETQPFLTTDGMPSTSFAVAYRFDAIVTGSLTHLTAALRERNVGRVTVMNVGSPRDVEAARKRLKLSGDQHRTLIFTKLNGQAATLVVERL